jgi:(2Fe-2S) ferredoxin
MKPRYEKHIFVCVKERSVNHPRGCCLEKGSMEIRKKFVQLINQHGLRGKVRANKSGCLDVCEMGVNLVIYPNNFWYTGVTEKDVDEIFKTSILHDEIVERLAASEKTWTTCEKIRKGEL